MLLEVLGISFSRSELGETVFLSSVFRGRIVSTRVTFEGFTCQKVHIVFTSKTFRFLLGIYWSAVAWKTFRSDLRQVTFSDPLYRSFHRQ